MVEQGGRFASASDRKKQLAKRKESNKKSSASVQQGGRFASAEDNIKNKQNTARLQGESTFQTLENGRTVTRDTKTGAPLVTNERTGNKQTKDQIKQDQIDTRTKELRESRNQAIEFHKELRNQDASQLGFRQHEKKKEETEKLLIGKDTPLSKQKFEKNEKVVTANNPQGSIHPSDIVSDAAISSSSSIDGKGLENMLVAQPEPQPSAKEFRALQKEFLDTAKESGATTLLFKTTDESGVVSTKTVPIDQGFREMVKNPSATVSVVPEVPKGFGVAGPLENQVFVPGKEKIEQGIRADKVAQQSALDPRGGQDPLSAFVSDFKNFDPNPPPGGIGPRQSESTRSIGENIQVFGVAAAVEGANILTSGSNLLLEGAKKIPGSTGLGAALIPPADVARSAPGELISAPIGAAIESKDLAGFSQATQKGVSDVNLLIQQQGFVKTAAQTAVIVAPVGKNPIRLTKIPIEVKPSSTLKSATFGVKVTTPEGSTTVKTFKDFQKARNFELEQQKTLGTKTELQASQDIIKSLEIGGKPIISKVGDKTVIGSGKGKITPEDLAALDPTGRGLEITTLKPAGAKILADEAGIDALQQAGKLTPEQAKIAKQFPEVVEALDFAEKKINRKDLKIPSKLSTALETKAEQEVLTESILPGLGKPAKGSVVLKSAVKSGLLIEDIDVDFGKATKQASKQIERGSGELESVMQGSRGTEIQGTKLYTGTIGDDLVVRLDDLKLGKGEIIHGTNLGSVKSILSEGIDVAADLRGVGFFGTTNKGLAAKFAARAAKRTGDTPSFALLKIDNKQILRFSDLGPDLQRQVRSSNYAKFQDNLIKLAKEQNFKAVEKPYKSLSPKAKSNEIIIIDESIAKGAKQITPSSVEGLLRDRKKLLEFLTNKDEIAGVGSKAGDTSQILGMPIFRRTAKATTAGGEKVELISLESQAKRMIADFGSIQGPRVEKSVGQNPDFLNPGSKLSATDEGFRLGSPDFRLKTPSRLPITLEKIAGDLEKQKPRGFEKRAQKLRSFAKELRETYPEIEFEEIGKSIRSTGKETIELDNLKPSTTSQQIIQTSGKVFSDPKLSIPSSAAAASTEGIGLELVKLERETALGHSPDEILGFTKTGTTDKIFINTGFKTKSAQIKELPDTLMHETMHIAVEKAAGKKASVMMDNLFDNPKTASIAGQKLAPSQTGTLKMFTNDFRVLIAGQPASTPIITNQNPSIFSLPSKGSLLTDVSKTSFPKFESFPSIAGAISKASVLKNSLSVGSKSKSSSLFSKGSGASINSKASGPGSILSPGSFGSKGPSGSFPSRFGGSKLSVFTSKGSATSAVFSSRGFSNFILSDIPLLTQKPINGIIPPIWGAEGNFKKFKEYQGPTKLGKWAVFNALAPSFSIAEGKGSKRVKKLLSLTVSGQKLQKSGLGKLLKN